MIYRFTRPVTLALTGLAIISCNYSTAPNPAVEEVASGANLDAAVSNTWITRANMPSTERWAGTVAAAAVPNSAGQWVVYIIGGRSLASGATLGKVQAYNVATNTWSYKASAPAAFALSNGTGVINGKIYVSGGLVGGGGRNRILKTLFRYDPATDTWTRKRDMPNTTAGGVTGVIKNQLYVLTDCDAEECEHFEPAAFYRYDPTTDQWTSLPLPPSELGWSIAGTIGGKFYVTDGSRVGVFDPATNGWTLKTPAGQVSSIAEGVALQAKLYALSVGLRNPDGTLPTRINVYDPATNAWTSRAPVNLKQVSAMTRVQQDGSPRIEMVGGARPGNNLQYIP